MVPTSDILYIITISVLLGVAYRIDMRITAFFSWLEEITMIGGEIINRLDRLVSQLYDLSQSFHKDYDFLSSQLFKETMKSARAEICKEVLQDFKTKNGALRKKIADEIVKLAVDRSKNSKTKEKQI